jgi:peptide/nickel transport system permease protein
LRNSASVRDEIVERVPATVQLSALALALGIAIALPLASSRRSSGDHRWVASRPATQVGIALPQFFLGLLLLYFVALRLRWLPPGGYTAFTDSPATGSNASSCRRSR